MMDFLEKVFDFFFALTFYAFRHHGRRRFGNRATGSFKTDIADLIPFHLHVNHKAIATKRIETFGFPGSVLHLVIITRFLVVVQDDLLIELVKFVHSANTSFTL